MDFTCGVLGESRGETGALSPLTIQHGLPSPASGLPGLASSPQSQGLTLRSPRRMSSHSNPPPEVLGLKLSHSKLTICFKDLISSALGHNEPTLKINLCSRVRV